MEESSRGRGSAEPATRQGAARSTDESRHRVVFLGTSLTAGYGLGPAEKGYVDVVQQLADSVGYPVEMVNAGVSGDTSAGGLRRTPWILDDPVDVLVIELGANDGLRGQATEALSANLREIVRLTRERYPGVSLVIAGMEAPTNMGAVYTSGFRRVFEVIADETGATLIPFLLEGVAGIEALNQGDRIHPTAEGHAIMARSVVWPTLEPILAALGDPGP